MKSWETVMYSLLEEDVPFSEAVTEALDDLGLSVKEFCDETGLSESNVYKVTSGRRENPQLNSVEGIIQGIRDIETSSDRYDYTIAIITNREALEGLGEVIEVEGNEIRLERYPATTVEDAMIQGITAEREGVDAIICGPITAHTLEDVLRIPCIGLHVRSGQLRSAVDTAIDEVI
jgi:predicted transcriptional regulator